MKSNESVICQSCPSRIFAEDEFIRRGLRGDERTQLDLTSSYRIDTESGGPRCIHPERLSAFTCEDDKSVRVEDFHGEVSDVNQVILWVHHNIKKMSPSCGLSDTLDELHHRFVAAGGDATTFVDILRQALNGLATDK